jgi:hypothetical protein
VALQWVATLQAEVGAWIGLGRDLGSDFFSNLHKELDCHTEGPNTQRPTGQNGYVHPPNLDPWLQLQQTGRAQGFHVGDTKASEGRIPGNGRSDRCMLRQSSWKRHTARIKGFALHSYQGKGIAPSSW